MKKTSQKKASTIKKKTKAVEDAPIEKIAQPVAKAEEVIPEYVDAYDMLRISDIQGAAEKSKLTMHLFEQELAKKNLELKLKEIDIQQSQVKLNNQHVDYKGRNKNLAELVNEMKLKYKVSGDFAFDPISGKIVR